MNRRKWLWTAFLAVPVLVGGGLAYTNNQQKAGGYTCPVTGEALPCEKCCPLNGEKAATETGATAAEPNPVSEGDYVCPLTGERLGCPNCCPLNKSIK